LWTARPAPAWHSRFATLLSAVLAAETTLADVDQPLPLNEPVTVEFTPTRSGEAHYACAMGHVRGVVFVP
jgi:plastocyanin domain-containing protein